MQEVDVAAFQEAKEKGVPVLYHGATFEVEGIEFDEIPLRFIEGVLERTAYITLRHETGRTMEIVATQVRDGRYLLLDASASPSS